MRGKPSRLRAARKAIRKWRAGAAEAFFRHRLHRSQVETGFFMTPWPLVVAIMAPIGGRLSDRYPVGILGGIGLVLLHSPHQGA
jgi:hypothetical protein